MISISNFVSAFFSIAFFVLIAFGLSQWFKLPAGSFADWLIAGAIFLWLLIVVIVPWNIYFRAKEVLNEAEISQENRIRVDDRQVNFVRVWVKRSLVIAISLHIISALVLYIFAVNGIGAIGYWGAIAALLLTALRPVISAYEYLTGRLYQIGQQVKYPREDILTLRQRVEQLAYSLEAVQKELNPEVGFSLAGKQQEWIEYSRQQLAQLQAQIEHLRAVNQQEHEQLSREAKQAIAQITEDSQFLHHARELIRFFKSA